MIWQERWIHQRYDFYNVRRWSSFLSHV